MWALRADMFTLCKSKRAAEHTLVSFAKFLGYGFSRDLSGSRRHFDRLVIGSSNKPLKLC